MIVNENNVLIDEDMFKNKWLQLNIEKLKKYEKFRKLLNYLAFVKENLKTWGNSLFGWDGTICLIKKAFLGFFW